MSDYTDFETLVDNLVAALRGTDHRAYLRARAALIVRGRDLVARGAENRTKCIECSRPASTRCPVCQRKRDAMEPVR